MILVLLGTQDKPFLRLLKMVSKEIDKGNFQIKIWNHLILRTKKK